MCATSSDKSVGEKNLETLLRDMSPVLTDQEYVFLSFPDAAYGEHTNLKPIASFQEQEGLTLVVPKVFADRYQYTAGNVYRCITLQVHSSLDAVGLTAAFARQLTGAGISANVIAGFYHDHIFVSVTDADKAVAALQALAGR